MSFILDALRRSEQDRGYQAGANTSLPVPTGGRSRRWRPWLLLGAISMNFAVLAWLLWPQPQPLPPAPAVAAVSKAAAPAATREQELESASLTELAGQPPQPLAAPPPKPMPTSAAALAIESQPPWLFELPDSFRQSLPAIQIGMHVHARQPQSRFVMVDGRQYREGQELAPGLRLLEITAQGVVLSHQGQRFQMPLR